MATKLKIGDVFTIALDDTRFGIGQLAGNWKGELYVIVFDKIVDGNPTAQDVEGATPLLEALTLDAKFYHGDWRIVGNWQQNLAAVSHPWFKIEQHGLMHVEARDRSSSRKATRSEVQRLRFRTVVAPIRVENAIKALHGVGDWHPVYEELRAGYAQESNQLVSG